MNLLPIQLNFTLTIKITSLVMIVQKMHLNMWFQSVPFPSLGIRSEYVNLLSPCTNGQVVREHHVTGRDVEHFRRHLYDGKSGPTSKGTEGAALVDDLIPLPGEHVLVKSRFSAFFATNLDLVLRRVGIEHIAVAGACLLSCQTSPWMI